MAIGISGINGADYSAYINQAQGAGLSNQISNMNMDEATDVEMMNACKEFEAYMVEQVYKSMQNTIMKSDDEENDYMSYFGDLQVQEYAKMVSEQGNLGLAQQLYDAMKLQQSGISIEELHAQEAAQETAGQEAAQTVAVSEEE